MAKNNPLITPFDGYVSPIYRWIENNCTTDDLGSEPLDSSNFNDFEKKCLSRSDESIMQDYGLTTKFVPKAQNFGPQILASEFNDLRVIRVRRDAAVDEVDDIANIYLRIFKK